MLVNPNTVNIATVADKELFFELLQTNVYLLTPYQITHTSSYVQISPFSIVIDGIIYHFQNNIVVPISTDNLQNSTFSRVPDGTYTLELSILNTLVYSNFQVSTNGSDLSWPLEIYFIYAPTPSQNAIPLATVSVENSTIETVTSLTVPLFTNLVSQPIINTLNTINEILVSGPDLSMSGSTGTNITNATLATTGVTPGTYGNSTNIPQITVDSKGRITSASNVAFSSSTSSSTTIPSITAIFTSSGSWTVPDSVTTILVSGCAGGGGGAYYTGNYAGGGGGGGQAVIKRSISVTPGSNITVTIGSGGNGAIYENTLGGNGGDTILATTSTTLLSLGGGCGGDGVNGGEGFPNGGSYILSYNGTNIIAYGGDGASTAFGGGGKGSSGSYGGYAYGYGSGGGGTNDFGGGNGSPGIIIIEVVGDVYESSVFGPTE